MNVQSKRWAVCSKVWRVSFSALQYWRYGTMCSTITLFCFGCSTLLPCSTGVFSVCFIVFGLIYAANTCDTYVNANHRRIATLASDLWVLPDAPTLQSNITVRVTLGGYTGDCVEPLTLVSPPRCPLLCVPYCCTGEDAIRHFQHGIRRPPMCRGSIHMWRLKKWAKAHCLA
jgi:hypothetical protein